ncbi:hypothetical protein [Pseudomonas syringae]|uniref:hypothetical protein n=1 Tax=Pseudomonas syringae TaxID=317 RepID=UPI002248DC83|nr:hypothetical protein [Pseudomonas syringae]UZS69275.1 hypothetical protein OQB65_08005 [Pseudomonas syringae]
MDAYWKGIVSGPHGLVGGFPAVIRSKALKLDVEGLDRPALEQWNIAQESGDGVLINKDVEYTTRAVELMRHHVPELSASWPINDASIGALMNTTRQIKNRLKSLGRLACP